jgi:biopolymer transport protein TolR
MASLVSRGGRGRRTINEINMVPFIDVMLVLLIIFMVTAPLITPSMIDLPSIGKAGRQPDQVLQIVVGKDEQLSLKSADKTLPVTLATLAQTVRQLQASAAPPTPPARPQATGQTPDTANTLASTTAVVISADRSVKYEQVVKVMDTLQRAGIQRVGLSVQLAN